MAARTVDDLEEAAGVAGGDDDGAWVVLMWLEFCGRRSSVAISGWIKFVDLGAAATPGCFRAVRRVSDLESTGGPGAAGR